MLTAEIGSSASWQALVEYGTTVSASPFWGKVQGFALDVMRFTSEHLLEVGVGVVAVILMWRFLRPN